jgi:CubicO group peptidase (beta-lactamase class C family)
VRSTRRGAALVAAALILLPSGAARAQEPRDAALQAVVDGLVEDAFVGAGLSGARQVFHVPGAVLTVDPPGRPARTFAAGVADLRGAIPMRADRPQPVGSGTKPMTAVLVLDLVQRGRIALDEPLARAAARHRRDRGRLARLTRRYRHRLRGVTVRRLLNMTSGLQDYMNSPMFARDFAASPRARRSMTRLASWGLSEKRLFRPGAPGRTYYSNTNYVLLGMLVEAVTGGSYASRLRDLFRRAGMRSSSYPTSLLSSAVARGYGPPLPGGRLPSPLRQLRAALADAPRITATTDPARVWTVSSNSLVEGPTVPLSPAGPADEARYGGARKTTWQDVTRAYDLAGLGSAAGAAVSTTQDLARFWDALFGGRLLRPRTVRLLRQSVPAPPNAPGVRNYYGLGVQRQDVAPGAFWSGSPRLRIWMKLGDVFGYTSASYYIEGPSPYDHLVVTNTTNLFPSPVGDLGVLRDTLRAVAPRPGGVR